MGDSKLSSASGPVDLRHDVEEIVEEESPLLGYITTTGKSPEYGTRHDEVESDSQQEEIEPPELSTWETSFIIGSMYIGVFLAAVDGTIVASLLSHIASDLNAFKSVSWIATGYLISNAAFQPLFGKLTNIFGRKQGLLCCNFLFGLGCLLCGIANSMPVLILARVIQGIGGGGLTAISSITTSDLVSIRKRGMYQGIANLFFGVGSGVGGGFGGFVSDTFGWRWSFLCQLPVVIISMICVAWKLKVPPHPSSAATENSGFRSKLARVDFYGSFSLSSALVVILLDLSCGGNSIPWTDARIFIIAIAGVLLLGLFCYVETHIAKEPVIPLGLFRDRTILGAALSSMLSTIATFSYIFYAPVYFISVLSMSASQAGLRLTANYVGVATGTFISGFYIRRYAKYKALLMISNVCFTLSACLLMTFGLNTPVILQFLGLYLPGATYAIMLTVSLIALIASVPHDMRPVTLSIQYTARGVGSTVGVALASAVFQNALSIALDRKVSGLDKSSIIDRVRSSVDAIRTIPKQYQPAVIASYLTASKAAFSVVLIMSILLFITNFMIRDHKL